MTDVAEKPPHDKPDEGSPSEELSFLFDDGFWDDAFATLYDPTMRVCSSFGC